MYNGNDLLIKVNYEKKALEKENQTKMSKKKISNKTINQLLHRRSPNNMVQTYIVEWQSSKIKHWADLSIFSLCFKY